MNSKSLKISICQMDIKWEDKGKNREKAECFICEASEKKADFILFPEMSLTGFSMNIRKTGELFNETISCVQTLAKQYEIAIGIGWVKLVGEKAENHYTVINCMGKILSDYVKIHPFSFSGEDKWFNSGKTIVDFRMNDIPCGNFICYDLRFPEIFQISSEKNHIIFLPANWPKKRHEHWIALLKARAIENQIYIVGINCIGKQEGVIYSGDSCVVNPNGEIIAQSNTEGIIYCEIGDDVDSYRETFPTKKDRKNDFYRNYL